MNWWMSDVSSTFRAIPYLKLFYKPQLCFLFKGSDFLFHLNFEFVFECLEHFLI